MQVVLTVLAAILFALGWVIGKIALAANWTWHAMKVGWKDAHKPRKAKPPNPDPPG